MAVDVYLKRKDGSVVDVRLCDHLWLIQDARAKYGETLPCVFAIYQYDATLFNARQVAAFLVEWEQVRSIADTDERIAVWEAIRQRAQRCLAEGLYLLFLGD